MAHVYQLVQYPKYANNDDRRCAMALVDAVLKRNLQVSIWDTEDYAIERSTNKLAILKQMSHCEMEWLEIYKPGIAKELGAFFLIYNNGSEGDPMILITDHSANNLCNEIWNELNAKFER